MTTNIRALTMNEHLDLEIGKHPERTFFATLMNSQPQFSIDYLNSEVQTEAEHWMASFSGSDGKSFLEVFKSVEHVFDALKHEGSSLKDVEKAITAHKQGEWGEASKYYGNALSDLHFAVSDWEFAIHEIADDTPFDPYYPSRAEREKHNVEEPPRASYEDMREVAPMLFRIFRNLDRMFCVGQELIQRQITCLTIHMQELEAQQAASFTHVTTGNQAEETLEEKETL